MSAASAFKHWKQTALTLKRGPLETEPALREHVAQLRKMAVQHVCQRAKIIRLWTILIFGHR